jgi:superfamily II DNA/RNA helicase
MKEGKILIFVNQRDECENLCSFLGEVSGATVLSLHGQKNQY